MNNETKRIVNILHVHVQCISKFSIDNIYVEIRYINMFASREIILKKRGKINCQFHYFSF